jgi:hypothetical protein
MPTVLMAVEFDPDDDDMLSCNNTLKEMRNHGAQERRRVERQLEQYSTLQDAELHHSHRTLYER